MGKWGAIACAAWCLIALAIVGVRLHSGRAIDTDIQALLPAQRADPVLSAAMTSAGQAAASRVAILASSEKPGRAAMAAKALEAALIQSGVFAPDRDEGDGIGRWLFANRFALLCEEKPQDFDGAAAARQSLALIFAPIVPFNAHLLRQDPFLRTLSLSQCLAPNRGKLAADSALVSGRLTASAFRLDVQDRLLAALRAWQRAWPDVAIARAGAVFHAEFGARQAKGEIGLIGMASLALVLVGLFFVFRRPQAVLGVLAVTAAGAIGSLGAALLVFPRVHVLVFVFGSALIGVTSDYALHYLATGPQTGWAPAKERVRLVSRPLFGCMISTALGFGAMAAFGIPLFQQVAVFSIAGLATAWAFTLTVLPLMDPPPKNQARLMRWWEGLEGVFTRWKWSRIGVCLAGLLVLGACIWGSARYRTLDDVRQFQQGSAALKAEEARLRAAIGYSLSPSFLLSRGESADAARAREEAALAGFSPMARGDVLAASRFDPSKARRAANEAALQERLFAPFLAQRQQLLGLGNAPPDAPLAAKSLAPLPRFVAELGGSAGGQYYVIAPLGPRAERETIQVEGAKIVNPAALYSQAFTGFRGLIGIAMALAFAICGAMLVILYRSVRALSILLAPLIGVLLAIALPSGLGLPASFFSMAALFVVLGAGIDHSVFQFEAAHTPGPKIELPVFLDAATTILSMGMLGLSNSYPVQVFGIAVAFGVGAAYLFSAIAGRFGSKRGI